MKPAQLDGVSYRGAARRAAGAGGERGRAGPCPPPAPRQRRYPAALPRADVVYSRSPSRAASGQQLPVPRPARLASALPWALMDRGRQPPATCPAPPRPPPALQTPRSRRDDLCVSVCASGSPAGRGCNGAAEWLARPSLSRPANGGSPYIPGSVVALLGLHGSVWSRVPRAPRRRGSAARRVSPRPCGAPPARPPAPPR